MRFHTWPVLIFAFSLMLLLMVLSAMTNWRQTGLLFDKWEGLTRSYQDSEQSLQQIRSDVQVSGLLVRDFLLDPSDPGSDTYKKRLLADRAELAGGSWEVTCGTRGKECRVQGAGKPFTVSFWYNGPALVEMETQGKDEVVTKRKMLLSEDGSTLTVEVTYIVPDGRGPEKLVLKKER